MVPVSADMEAPSAYYHRVWPLLRPLSLSWRRVCFSPPAVVSTFVARTYSVRRWIPLRILAKLLRFLGRFVDLSDSVYADVYFGLCDALAELFGCEVDLLTGSPLENSYLRRRIEA